MIFSTSIRKLHLIGNFCTFKTQSNEYNYIYIYVENYKYIKNSKRLWKYIKAKQKTTVFSQNIYIFSIYILYVLLNVMLLGTVSFFYWNINGMLQVEPMTNILFSLIVIALYAPRFSIVWWSRKRPPWLSIDSGWFFFLDGLDIGTILFQSWWYWFRFFRRRDNFLGCFML